MGSGNAASQRKVERGERAWRRSSGQTKATAPSGPAQTHQTGRNEQQRPPKFACSGVAQWVLASSRTVRCPLRSLSLLYSHLVRSSTANGNLLPNKTKSKWELRVGMTDDVTKRQHGTALHGTGRGVLDRTGRTDAASRRAPSAQTGLSVARSASCFAKLSRADTCFCSDSPRTCL